MEQHGYFQRFRLECIFPFLRWQQVDERITSKLIAEHGFRKQRNGALRPLGISRATEWWYDPKIGYGDGAALFNDGFSDSHFVENASYLKLATLTLGYTIPKTIVSKLGMSKIRLYLQGQNLFTITGYSGLDPETQSRNGVDWNGMPQQRSFTFGANVTF